jgi:hypothetical protein
MQIQAKVHVTKYHNSGSQSALKYPFVTKWNQAQVHDQKYIDFFELRITYANVHAKKLKTMS